MRLALGLGLALGPGGSAGGFNPAGHDLLADFENSQFFWGSQSRTLANLTANGDGSYDLAYNGFWETIGPKQGTTLVCDYINNNDYVGAAPVGTMVSISGPSSLRGEIVSHNVSGTQKLWRGIVTPGPTVVNATMQNPTPDAEGGATGGRGRRRAILVIQPQQQGRTLTDNNMQLASGATITISTVPSKITFGRRAFDNADRLTNVTLLRVAAFRGAKTQAEIEAIAAVGIKPPWHILGDSFGTAGVLKEELLKLRSNGYIAFSQDCVGGSSLTAQASRFASPYTKWHKSTVIIMDGGFDGTLAEATAAIDSIRARINAAGHDRFLYVQSNPQVGTSSGQARIDWNAKDAGVLAYVGANHYCATLAGMQALTTGDGPDNANVADGLWPASVLADTIHPNAAVGYPGLAAIINARAVALGYA